MNIISRGFHPPIGVLPGTICPLKQGICPSRRPIFQGYIRHHPQRIHFLCKPMGHHTVKPMGLCLDHRNRKPLPKRGQNKYVRRTEHIRNVLPHTKEAGVFLQMHFLRPCLDGFLTGAVSRKDKHHILPLSTHFLQHIQKEGLILFRAESCNTYHHKLSRKIQLLSDFLPFFRVKPIALCIHRICQHPNISRSNQLLRVKPLFCRL